MLLQTLLFDELLELSVGILVKKRTDVASQLQTYLKLLQVVRGVVQQICRIFACFSGVPAAIRPLRLNAS